MMAVDLIDRHNSRIRSVKQAAQLLEECRLPQENMMTVLRAGLDELKWIAVRQSVVLNEFHIVRTDLQIGPTRASTIDNRRTHVIRTCHPTNARSHNERAKHYLPRWLRVNSCGPATADRVTRKRFADTQNELFPRCH